MEPGPELRHLHEAILRQDPRLEPPDVVEATRLPPELDTATPLLGREAELDWLRGHWRRALAGDGRLVLVAGERGIGKTRLVAELAEEVLQDGGAVLYVLRLRRGGRRARRPPLAGLANRRCWCSTTSRATLDPIDGDSRRGGARGGDGGAGGALAAGRRDAGAEAAERRWRARLRPALCGRDGGRRRAGRAPAGRQRRLAAACCTVWRRSGRACWSCAASPTRSAASPPTGPGCAPRRTTSSGASSSCRPPGSAPSRERGPRRGLPVQGAGLLRGRRRGLLLRARAVRGRAGRARDGRPVPGDRRAVGQRQVLGAARRSARRARRGCAARERGVGARRVASRGASAARARAGARPRRATTAGWSWRSTSSRRCSRPAATRRSARRSSTRSWPRCETCAGARWWSSPCAPTSTVAARPTRSCRACLGAGHVLVGPMLRDELRRAIELPARRAGLLVERELVDALLADVEGQPGALPLVSSALLELWQRRDGRRAALVRLRAGRGRARRGRAAGRAGLRAARPRGPAARPAGPAAAGRRGRGRRRRAAPRPAEPSSRATPSRMSWTCSPRRG